MKFLITLFAIFGACLAASTFEGYKVLRVKPGTDEAVEKFRSLINNPEVNLWDEHHGSFDVMVSPKFYATFVREMQKEVQTAGHLMIDDVQKLIDQQMKDNKIAKMNSKSDGKAIDHTFYRTLDEIYLQLDAWAAANSFMSVSTIGTTFEGRPQRLMKVSTGGADTRPVIWIDCGIHAREWVTPSSCLYYLDQLTNYGVDPAITTLLDTYDFYILTVFNPDGYAFTWSDNRMWRKNRTPDNLCFGVDLNRNFATGFGGAGASDQPCGETYHGPVAFSELESQAVRDTLLGFNGRVFQYYDMHSYSQLWMYPNGYTTALTADDAEQNRVAAAGVSALTSVYGTSFVYGPIATTIYVASGGTVDWCYDPVGIIYSYTLEMRDTGAYGFLLPPDQILPVGDESWTGVLAAINAAANP